jgi:hypothetical protein
VGYHEGLGIMRLVSSLVSLTDIYERFGGTCFSIKCYSKTAGSLKPPIHIFTAVRTANAIELDLLGLYPD